MIDRQAALQETIAHVSAGRMSQDDGKRVIVLLESAERHTRTAREAWEAVNNAERDIKHILNAAQVRANSAAPVAAPEGGAK